MLVFTAVALAAVVMAAPQPMVVMESRMVPRGWERRGDAPANHSVPLTIALKPKNENAILEQLEQISNPASDRYGHYLSREELLELLEPSEESRQAVHKWLSDNQVTTHGNQLEENHSGDMISFDLPLEAASRLLGGAQFSEFEHLASGALAVRTTEYRVPRDVASHIDYVGGTTYFSTLRSLRKPSRIVNPDYKLEPEGARSAQAATTAKHNSTGAPTACNASAVTSKCLRELYGTYDYQPKQPSRAHIGVAGFLEENANYDDLKRFLEVQRPEAQQGNATFNYVTLNGAQNNQSAKAAGGEANLDIQTVVGMTWPIRTSFYSVGGRPPFHKDKFTPKNQNEPYTKLLTHLLSLGDDKLPQVLSISYGDDEQTVPERYAKRACLQFAALGLRGVSVLDATGDLGVGSDKEDQCVTNDRRHKKTFLPEFPAGCPYVTSVGAVQDFSPEVVTKHNFSNVVSGGGFSNYFPRPGYQNASVPNYLVMQVGQQYHGLFNPRGRAYPDVSAQGSLFLIAVGRRFQLISGTSAATPTFASVVALLNDARMAKGKPPLGFLNPLIYTRLNGTDAFNDITHGSNPGCGVEGFRAAKGWDASTGFGTPNFKKMLEKLL